MSVHGRRHGKIGALLLAVLLLASYVLYALLQPLAAVKPAISFHFSRPAGTVTLAWPAYGEGRLAANGYGTLASYGDQGALPTASVIKLLTAFAVLQQKPLQTGEDGPLITITADDVASYSNFVAENGSVVRVTVGETLTERQALEALLLPSANNMAETLARWAFGSLDTFIADANRYTVALGMNHTTVTDPSGFTSTTVSTPADLILLGQAVLQQPVIASIVAEKTAVIPVQGLVRNYNAVLGTDGIIGLKTGNNDQDPGCFLFASQREIGGQGVTLVGVIMNAPSLSAALASAEPLIQSASKNFTLITVAAAGQRLATYQMPWGVAAYATIPSTLTMLVWNGNPLETKLALSDIAAPASAGAKAGSMTVTSGDQVLAADLTLRPALTEPNAFWRLTHPQ